MDHTRKLMTMHEVLHLRDDRDRLYICQEKKEEENSLILQIECMHRYDGPKLHKKKSKERLITATRNNLVNFMINRTTITRKITRQITRKTKMERKTTVWIYQATNKRNLTQEDLDMVHKENT